MVMVKHRGNSNHSKLHPPIGLRGKWKEGLSEQCGNSSMGEGPPNRSCGFRDRTQHLQTAAWQRGTRGQLP